MLSLYSDATFDSNLKMAVTATLILDNDGYCRTFFPAVYGGVRSSIHAELLGVCQSLQWVADNEPEAEIQILCDNLSIAERISRYPEDRRVLNGSPANLWFAVFNLLDKLQRPIVMHISSHQSAHNPNKTCDLLCGHIMRYLRMAQA